MINVEEKIIDMEAEKSDLFKKFQWIPHFDRLPFIYGMAITQTEVAVYELRRDGRHASVFHRAINNVEGRIWWLESSYISSTKTCFKEIIFHSIPGSFATTANVFDWA